MRSLHYPSGGILLPCQKYARAAKGPCPLESRPRDVTLYAVERSTESLWSPLDFVSGYGAISTPFRAGPTRSACRRALGRTPSAGSKRNGPSETKTSRQTPVIRSYLLSIEQRASAEDKTGVTGTVTPVPSTALGSASVKRFLCAQPPRYAFCTRSSVSRSFAEPLMEIVPVSST